MLQLFITACLTGMLWACLNIFGVTVQVDKHFLLLHNSPVENI